MKPIAANYISCIKPDYVLSPSNKFEDLALKWVPSVCLDVWSAWGVGVGCVYAFMWLINMIKRISIFTPRCSEIGRVKWEWWWSFHCMLIIKWYHTRVCLTTTMTTGMFMILSLPNEIRNRATKWVRPHKKTKLFLVPSLLTFGCRITFFFFLQKC